VIPFIKMHGCGNDYVFLDGFTGPVPTDPSSLAVWVSDRHRGIGADGLVLMLPPDVSHVAARMRMFNADGSEGSLCGNALRCMAMWLHQSGRCGTHFSISMGDRTIPAQILKSSIETRTAIVRVLIGKPVEQNAGSSDANRFVKYLSASDLTDVTLPRLISPVAHVSMGNPHTILFVPSLRDVDVERLGALIETHPLFPQRTNVEFVEIAAVAESTTTNSLAADVRIRVWERGSGETLACGSGACAVAVAASCAGLLKDPSSALIAMPGGNLGVLWDADRSVHLEGPAAEVFRGAIQSNSLE
jgi:diaminopimelate epimerase